MSLDIAEPQVLVQFADDALEWHHRILLRRFKGATWIVLTPVHDTEVQDLSQHALLPSGRGTAVPAHVAARCYLFEPGEQLDLARYHAQAARLAIILGGAPEATAAAGPAACWRVADTAADDFGIEVGDELVERPISGVIKGSVGLARCGTPPRWVFVERAEFVHGLDLRESHPMRCRPRILCRPNLESVGS